DTGLVKEVGIALTPHFFWDGVLICEAHAHIPRVEHGHLCGAKGKRGVLAHRRLRPSYLPLCSAANRGADRTLTSYPIATPSPTVPSGRVAVVAAAFARFSCFTMTLEHDLPLTAPVGFATCSFICHIYLQMDSPICSYRFMIG